MGINRPTNLNIRDVPGNGSIVGPSTSPTCVESTTVCESCFNTCGSPSMVFDQSGLGCQNTFCRCNCCDVVCGCDCILCTRTVPGGMYKPSEVYEAKERDAWPPNTTSTGATTCLCNINPGTIDGPCNAATGGYIICVSGGCGWIVAPASTEVTRKWYDRGDASTTANSVAACGDWFIPSCGEMSNPGYACRTYWDSYTETLYWTNSQRSSSNGWAFWFDSRNTGYGANKNSTRKVRAWRRVTY